MRCKKCNTNAVINMRHHKLALCGEHYGEWFLAQTDRAIEKYKMFSRDERVLVAVSGGKDSLSLWDALLRLGYQADGLYIGLGINDPAPYSDVSLDKTRAFLESVIASREAAKQSPTSDAEIASQTPLAMTFTPTLHVVDVQETYGKTIPQIAQEKNRGHGKPCSSCGLTKRYVMNRLALEKGYTVLATGHNLDDEAAVLFQNTLRWQTQYLARQSPTLPASHEGLVKKVKPFVRFYERETATYALVRELDYVYDECPHAVGNLTNFYKTLLNQLEANSPGAKLSFYLEFLRARGEGVFDGFNQQDQLHACEVCGQPTTAPGRCAFCRMWDVSAIVQ
ncbi:MAG: adenine nucleotide alpha hydrolase family protein [Chloroflexi bacterium]|nr:adenine nucleotide alpha hydrolase family protein [Chloroflexota bacterium]